MISLQSSPGSRVSIILETKVNEQRIDGYSAPFIARMILPDYSLSPIYPIDMVRFDTGIYYHRFMLPNGPMAIGTYLVDIHWADNANNQKTELYQIIVSNTSSGTFSVSPT